MLRSKKLKKINTINHGFFNSLGGFSSGIYKSLNCGMGSKDNKKYVKKNLKYVAKKIGVKKIVLLHQVHGKKIFSLNKISNKKLIVSEALNIIPLLRYAILDKKLSNRIIKYILLEIFL